MLCDASLNMLSCRFSAPGPGGILQFSIHTDTVKNYEQPNGGMAPRQDAGHDGLHTVTQWTPPLFQQEALHASSQQGVNHDRPVHYQGSTSRDVCFGAHILHAAKAIVTQQGQQPNNAHIATPVSNEHETTPG